MTGRPKAVLLAAGLGTRLRPLTDTMPKCLVPIGGRPLLDYWFASLEKAGIPDVLINTHTFPEQVEEFLRRANGSGRFRARTTHEPELLGSAGTVRANRDWADGASDVLVIYADNLSEVDLAELLAFHRSHEDPVTMLLFHTPWPERCGIAEVDERHRITAFVEKPANPRSDLANGGLYVVEADAYREIADMACFDLGFHVLPRFVGRMRGWVFDGVHVDIGTPEGLEQARSLVAAGTATMRPSVAREPAARLETKGTTRE